MSGLKGRVLLFSFMKTVRAMAAVCALRLAWTLALGHSPGYLGDVTDVLLAGLWGQGGTWIAWNVADAARRLPGEIARARRPAPAPPPGSGFTVTLDAGTVSVYAAGDCLLPPAVPGLAAAVQRAQAAGMLSVNGRRYPGPPPVHSAGRARLACEASFTRAPAYEARDGVRLIHEPLEVERVMLPSGSLRAPRVSKSECDMCGVPLDVAWCSPGACYLCPLCREQ